MAHPIPLGTKAVVLVDDADYEWTMQWRWYLGSEYAMRRNDAGQSIYLHRELLGLQAGDGLEADHINCDKLDCRRANLRVVRHRENAQNLRPRLGTSSRYRGVTWNRRRQNWQTQVMVNGKNHSFGHFESEEEAGRAAAEGRRRVMPFAVS